MNPIYEFIISSASISNEHFEQLREKRGFTAETIKKLRFVSGGNYLLDFEKELIEKHDKSLLLSSKVCIENKELCINPMLLKDNILIPYLDKEGKVTHIRPHKFGLKDLPVEIYHEFSISDGVVLTEGEFKAVACYQLGIPAIAIPGISSFSGQNFKRLVKTFNENKVREICIIFDNEVKDSPEFPSRYKENPMDRYDTQFYAWFMAKQLEKEGFSCRVGWLPDGWRVDGKIDLDGALAQGKGFDDITHVIRSAKSPRAFLEDQPKEIQDILIKKDAKRFFRTHIRTDYGKYVATRYGKKEWDEIISNFVIDVIATHLTAQGIVREIEFTNEFGQKSSSVSITAEEMYGSDSFGSFCLNKGNFIWRGRREDLANIWESEFLEDDGRYITELDHIGDINSEKLFVFGNVAFSDDGQLRPDTNNIFWNGKRGIKPMSIDVSGRKEDLLGIPYLSLKQFKAEQLRENLIKAVGETEAKLCLGWCSSVLFMGQMFNEAGCFPILFLTGKRSSGKSHVAKWLMHFFGIETEGIQAQDTTPVGLQRYLGYYSSLPVFVDEYRNNDKVTNKNGVIRNTYNRQSAIKGIKSDFGVRVAPIRGTMIIAGQELPRDNAIMTRSIVVQVTEAKRSLDNPFNWFTKNKPLFSNVAYQILGNLKDNKNRFVQKYHEAKDYFSTISDDRKASNYGCVAAGYYVLFGDDQSFAVSMSDEVKRVNVEIEADEESMVFWEDILALKHSGAIDKQYWVVEGDNLFVYFQGLYNLWAEDYARRNREPAFTASSLLAIIKNEKYYIEQPRDSRRKTLGTSQQRCICLDITKAPDAVKDMVG